MYTLIAFATQWGSKNGGINSFNTDFLKAFGAGYCHSVRVVCIVNEATDAEEHAARRDHVILISLARKLPGTLFSRDHAQSGLEELRRHGIEFSPEKTIWLGHDRITGIAAVEAALCAGGRSALIHHMSYDHYESFAENSQVAYGKAQEQQNLFERADIVLAVGPLLRDAAKDLIGSSKEVQMLIPGLAEIEVRPAPRTFVAFLSGRLTADAARIKQGHLGIAAFAHAHKSAFSSGMPDALLRQPKLMLRGADFVGDVTTSEPSGHPEGELKAFAESYAGRAINLQALPYTLNREQLYSDMSRSSVALMPSWHEGFGLVAWEAIAAGVPLIVSRQSGVYRLLEEYFPGNGTGCVFSIDVKGSSIEPFFHLDDLEAVSDAIQRIAHQPERARQQAATLRGQLINKYTWADCAAHVVSAFDWPLKKGSSQSLAPVNPTLNLTSPSAQITAEGLPIRMPLKYWRAGPVVVDSLLLRAEEARVVFAPARFPDLRKLDAWLDDSEHLQAVRLVTGSGGLGKTRLALEVCERRIKNGWCAGFLDSEANVSSMLNHWKALSQLNRPLLIVVDYAETRQDVLLALISAMQQWPIDFPTRLLLLARDGGEWWDSLPGKSKICEVLLSSYATSGPYLLPPLHSTIEDRQLAYQQALCAFAGDLGLVAPDTIPDLAGEHFDRPLYLQMAALLALRGERPTTAQGLTRALLHHERRYWRGLLSDQSFVELERHAEQLLALTTLAGGVATPKAVQPQWERAYGKVLSAGQVAQLFYALIPLYPGKQGLQAVRPDLLGEALVAQALLRPSAADLLDSVLGKDAGQSIRINALTIFARLSDNYQDLRETLIEALRRQFSHCWRELIAVVVKAPSGLPGLAEAAFERLNLRQKDQVVGLLKPYIQQKSVQLVNLNLLASKFLVERREKKYNPKKLDDNAADYAYSAGVYAINLAYAGYSDDALLYAEKALRIHQLLAKKSEFYEDFYATSLGNYANRLSESGRDDEALLNYQKVLHIRRKLTRGKTDESENDYAISLGNYASSLCDVGRKDEALVPAHEALEIRKRLSQKDSERFEPDYATALSNYSSHLSDVGRNDEALIPAKLGLDIHRRLAQKNADRFEPEYASSLGNYANRLSDAGHDDEALSTARKTLEIRRQLAKKNPDRFGTSYAIALGNYASHLSDVGRVDEALEAAQEALEIEREASKSSDRFVAGYAMSLRNYGSHLVEVGRIEEALDTAVEALGICKTLVEKNQARFESEYGMAWYNYATKLCFSDRYVEALAASEEALKIYQKLTDKEFVRFSPIHYQIVCDNIFLNWLVSEGEWCSEVSEVPDCISFHRRRQLQVAAWFVGACCVKNQASRLIFFEKIINGRDELSEANKNATLMYWLCAQAWSAKYDTSIVNDNNWLAEWDSFVKKRKGRVPCWMSRMSIILEFEWPQ